MNLPRLELDYVAALRRPAWLGVLLLAAALALAAHLLSRLQEARLELARQDAADRMVDPERSRARAVPAARIDEELKIAEAVRRQLTLPWAALLETVEAAATENVAILLLQPDAVQRVLRLSAEARDRDAMFEYLRRLAAAPMLAKVHLVSHQVQLEDSRRPIRFSVLAALRSLP